MSKDKVMKAIVQVCGSVDPSLGKMVSNTEKSFGKINTKAAIVSAAVVAGLGAAAKELYDFGKASVESAGKFQSEMQNVATLLDGTEEEVSARVSEMQQEILSRLDSQLLFISLQTELVWKKLVRIFTTSPVHQGNQSASGTHRGLFEAR